MSVATVQSLLQATSWGDEIDIGPYLTTLCAELARSMIHDRRPVTLTVKAGPGTADSTRAVSLGLIVTELVINALKYAFAGNGTGHVIVEYAATAQDWRLSVSDDGQGLQSDGRAPSGGLGSRPIGALAAQIGARIERTDLAPGLAVTIIGEHRAMDADVAVPLDLIPAAAPPA